jgi:hypothetical protein
MIVAVTFCDQPEQERRENKQGYSSFGWSESKFFPQLSQPEMPTRFQQSRNFWDLVVDVILIPRSNHNGVIVAPDVRVIKARF